MHAFSSKIDDCQAIDHVCIAIKKVSDVQRHVGIFFKANGETKLLHLPWHKFPLLDEPDDEYIWYDVGIDELNKPHFAAMCQTIGENNDGEIPYGVFSNGAGFTKEFVFIRKNIYSGLTCATFVLEVFESQGYPLINVSTWPIRKEDTDWANKIIATLSNYLEHHKIVAPGFIQYQQRKISEGIARVRPEHVVGAASRDDIPNNFDTIDPLAESVLHDLDTIVP